MDNLREVVLRYACSKDLEFNIKTRKWAGSTDTYRQWDRTRRGVRAKAENNVKINCFMPFKPKSHTIEKLFRFSLYALQEHTHTHFSIWLSGAFVSTPTTKRTVFAAPLPLLWVIILRERDREATKTRQTTCWQISYSSRRCSLLISGYRFDKTDWQTKFHLLEGKMQ